MNAVICHRAALSVRVIDYSMITIWANTKISVQSAGNKVRTEGCLY